MANGAMKFYKFKRPRITINLNLRKMYFPLNSTRKMHFYFFWKYNKTLCHYIYLLNLWINPKAVKPQDWWYLLRKLIRCSWTTQRRIIDSHDKEAGRESLMATKHNELLRVMASVEFGIGVGTLGGAGL